MDADYTRSNDVEAGLNKEVDRAISDFRDEPEAQYEEPVDQREVADRISRIASEIQQVIPLILPKRNLAVSEEPELSQDPVLIQAAKNLLIAQIEKLKKLVGRLD